MTIAQPRPVDQSRGERLFRIASMLSAAQFVWIVLMGFIAGGQFTPVDDLKWDPLLEWPVVAVPSWLTIVLAAAACVGAVLALFGRTGVDHFGPAVNDIAITIIVLIAVPVLLSTVYLEPGGIVLEDFPPEATLGWHWIASCVGLLTLAALGVRIALALRAGRREAAK